HFAGVESIVLKRTDSLSRESRGARERRWCSPLDMQRSDKLPHRRITLRGSSRGGAAPLADDDACLQRERARYTNHEPQLPLTVNPHCILPRAVSRKRLTKEEKEGLLWMSGQAASGGGFAGGLDTLQQMHTAIPDRRQNLRGMALAHS